MSLRRPNGFISAGYDPLEVPNAPTIGTASIASATSVSVTFTAPSNVGGGAITSYVATARKTSDGTTISGTGSSSPVTISGLTTGDAYTVTVAAVNAFGAGPISAASNSVTPVEQQLWSWGYNGSGQLGLGNTANRSSPVQVGALTTWLQVAAEGGNFSLAIKTDGTLWSWGVNYSGQLGSNSIVSRSSPVQVGALTNWQQVSANGFSAAIKTDGTLWTWGQNSNGQLGSSSVVSRSSPVQVGALTNWNKVAVGTDSCAAIKTDGTLWAWGNNDFGTLGQNNYIFRSSPVQIGSLTNWKQVASGYRNCVAVKTDGTLWSWGNNYAGQLGLGDVVLRSSPVQVGALTDWAFVATNGRVCAAVKTNGTLWSWGYNSTGQLGLGNVVNRSSPVQVGALTTWSIASVGNGINCAAITTAGALWMWGANGSGNLGQNNVISRSSPVQVGALTTWLSVSGGTLAIKTG